MNSREKRLTRVEKYFGDIYSRDKLEEIIFPKKILENSSSTFNKEEVDIDEVCQKIIEEYDINIDVNTNKYIFE